MKGWNQSAERLAPFLLVAAFLVQGLVATVHMSATGDETHYLGMGVHLLREREWSLDDALAHPPLSYYLHSLPLLPVNIDPALFDLSDANQRGRLIQGLYPDDRLLFLARLPMLLLGALLGALAYRWVKRAYDPKAALLVLFLFAFNPVLLSHSALITPDVCLAFFTMLTFYGLWSFLQNGRPSRLLLSGLALGGALLSKYTGLLVVLSLPLLLPLPGAGSRIPRFRPRHLGILVAIALLVVNAGYFFSGSFGLLGDEPFRSRLFQGIQATGLADWIPSPLPRSYIRGLDWQYTVVENGFNYFLLGERSQRGWVHYYLVAFVLKTPLPLLLLTALAVGLALRRRPDPLQGMVLIPMLLFPLFFSLLRMSRGIRYVLPSYPLLLVALAPLLLWGIQSSAPWRRRAGTLLLAWYLAGCLWVTPHYLPYFNELAGGPSGGDRFLYESDFDWGQELKGLARYLESKGIPSIRLAYFGTADPRHYGIDYQLLPCRPGRPAPGLVAVSATALQFWGCFDWLREYRPLERVGYTLLIYDLPEGPGGESRQPSEGTSAAPQKPLQAARPAGIAPAPGAATLSDPDAKLPGVGDVASWLR